MNGTNVDLSVILPCYNEAKILKQSVTTVQDVLDKTVYRYEIIIAEDASRDGTDRIAKELAEHSGNIVWLHRDERVGRGSAVANGIKNARGKIVGFLDVDLEAHPQHILPLVVAIEQGADIATGVRQIKLRWYDLILKIHKVVTHYGYIWISQRILGTNLKDTEAGFKFFNRERILPILDEVKDQHWFWDTEIMVRPYLKGYKITEIPILFSQKYDRPSKVNIIRDSISHFKNLLIFRREIKKIKRNSLKF